MSSAPHPFTLRQLQYVVAVADLLSFRKAAERCHVSQSALSAQIAQVEDGLGLILFERDRRRVLPTPASADVLQRMRRLLADADALTDAPRRGRDPLSDPSLPAGVTRRGETWTVDVTDRKSVV